MTASYDVAAYREGYDAQTAAIYVRVSTDKQTVENQLRELRQIAERRDGKWSAIITTLEFPVQRAGMIGLGSMKCSKTPNGAGLTWSWLGPLIGSAAR